MRTCVAALLLAFVGMVLGATARSLIVAGEAASLDTGLSGAASTPCFKESRKLKMLPNRRLSPCDGCTFSEPQPHISNLYSLSEAVHSAQTFTCATAPATPTNTHIIEAGKALVQTTVSALTINACQTLSGSEAVCLADPGVPTVVNQVVKAFIETDSYYGLTQGWVVALPCAEQCAVHTDLAMSSLSTILEAAATEAYVFLCQGTSGTWSEPELAQKIGAVALRPLAQALARAVVPVPGASCPAASSAASTA